MKKRHLKLSLFIYVCLLWLVVPGILLAGTLNAEQLTQKVSAVSMLEGNAYTQGRKELEALYPDNEALFNELIQQAGDWRVRLLCEIVKERVTKRKDVDVFIGTPLKWPKRDKMELPIDEMGQIVLPRQASNIPMILVEKIWKGNEIMDWSSRKVDVYVCLIIAVGEIKTYNARPILEDIIVNDSYFSNRVEITKSMARPELSVQRVRSSAANALGNIGDPRSVPALTTIIERKVDDLEDSSKMSACRALIKCADKSSIEYLKKKGDESRNESFKKVMSSSILEVEKRTKMEK